MKPVLKDQIAIVTGASSGIGKATALALARHGANLTLASRNGAALKDLVGEIAVIGQQALVVVTDVTQPDQVSKMVETSLSHWGCIDILVSCAGKYIRAPITHVTREMLAESLEVNFYGGVYAIQAALPSMLAQKRGHIILVSSMDGKIALPLDAPYVSAKFALNGFGAVLRQELVGSGVAVSLILPGRVDTPMIENLHVPWISAKISPDTVAKEIIKAIHHHKAEVIVPFQAGLLYYISAFSPRLADKLTRWFHLQGWGV